jgi:hypothetical protein
MPFCLDSTHIYSLNTTGYVQKCQDSTYHCYGCLLSGDNPKWFWMKIQNSGVLGIGMHSINNIGFNFVCWGPFSSHINECDSLTSSNIKACLSSDLSINPATLLYVYSGKYYIFCITNSSNQSNSIYFTEVGDGLATTDCNVVSGIDSDNGYLSKNSILYQNSPNPVNDNSTINYYLNTSGFVELEIKNIFGETIEKLVNSNQNSGYHSIVWDSKNVPKGIFYYSLKVNNEYFSKRGLKIN